MTGMEREYDHTKAKPAGAPRTKPEHRIPGGGPSGLMPSFTWNTDSGGTVTSVLIEFDVNEGWTWAATAASFPAKASHGQSVVANVPDGLLNFTTPMTLSRATNSQGALDQIFCIKVICSDGRGGTDTNDLLFNWQARTQGPSDFSLSVSLGTPTTLVRMTETTNN